MGVSGGPYIVRDSSLVLELDAADRNSYVSGSLVWNDLSNNSGSVSTFTSASFDSESFGNIYLSSSFSSSFVGTHYWTRFNFTYQFAIYPTIILGSPLWTPSISAVSGWGNYTWHADINGGIYAGISTNDSSGRLNPTDPGCGPGALELNKWQIFVTTYASDGFNPGTFIMYKNGAQIAQKTLNVPLAVDGYNSYQAYGACKIASFLKYSRALSAQEVLQNYNAQKSRFGLK
jgi:hypothetical protein